MIVVILAKLQDKTPTVLTVGEYINSCVFAFTAKADPPPVPETLIIGAVVACCKTPVVPAFQVLTPLIATLSTCSCVSIEWLWPPALVTELTPVAICVVEFAVTVTAD